MTKTRDISRPKLDACPKTESVRVEAVSAFCYTIEHMTDAKASTVEWLLVWKTGNLHVGRAFCGAGTMPLVSPRMRFPSGIPVASDETMRGTLLLSMKNGE